MNTGSFSCFVCQSLNFFVFLSLLRRASPPFSIFISKLHEYKFVFLLCLSKLKIFVFLSLLRCASPAIFDFYLQTPRIQLNFSETDAIHRYQMNIVGLSLFYLNGTIWKNMNLCVAFATYFYLFCVPCLCSFLYRVHLCITCKK
ncbi:hypothetical protein GLYMA_18G090100v4 [Glycine max]|nr:hypothetical protein GLYMA_18G090100v4 [Glycine max]